MRIRVATIDLGSNSCVLLVLGATPAAFGVTSERRWRDSAKVWTGRGGLRRRWRGLEALARLLKRSLARRRAGRCGGHRRWRSQ